MNVIETEPRLSLSDWLIGAAAYLLILVLIRPLMGSPHNKDGAP